jgi:hypothetical protein
MTASSAEIAPAAPSGHVICAWCRAVLRPGDPRLPASHGVCPDCSSDLFRDVARLEGLSAQAPLAARPG